MACLLQMSVVVLALFAATSVYATIYSSGPTPLIGPAYKGCYVDRPDRDLNPNFAKFFHDNTPQKCQNHCRNKGFMFAGVQFAHECFCGNTFGRYSKKPDSACDKHCTGAPGVACGGTWRQSIYCTGFCTATFKAMNSCCVCKNGKTLKGDKCVDGKIGDDCSAPVNQWACENIQFSVCGGNNKCQCKPGFVSSGNNQHCICPAGKTLKNGACVTGKIGDDCSAPVNEWACENIQFSVCGGNNKCQCKPGFVSSGNKQRCICPAGKTLKNGACVTGKIGDDCSAPVNEWACENIQFSVCGGNNKCQCKPGFVSSGNNQRCICPAGKTLKSGACVTAKIGDSCASPVSARACNNLQNAFCNDNSRCKCKAGFTESSSGQCVNLYG